jgi:hypothetical protein
LISSQIKVFDLLLDNPISHGVNVEPYHITAHAVSFYKRRPESPDFCVSSVNGAQKSKEIEKRNDELAASLRQR